VAARLFAVGDAVAAAAAGAAAAAQKHRQADDRCEAHDRAHGVTALYVFGKLV
jgi:hypothetical protein